jgi:SAM-dependent methyltransferase
MPSYEIFGKFYDAVMGDRARSAKHLHQLICEAKPNARTVLELGCGSGSILKYLARYYDISGLDISGQMLTIAGKKLPGARLYRQDMVNFQIDDHFDVICCVFDSINHITRFSDWNRVFKNVHRHLLPGGCFIFDINTQRKLKRLIAEPPWVHQFGKNWLIMDVTSTPNRASNWNIRVFEHRNKNRYTLHEENIVEVSFPPGKIAIALSTHFAKVRIIDPDRDRPSTLSERLFFVVTN